jgi:hypothetical protein
MNKMLVSYLSLVLILASCSSNLETTTPSPNSSLMDIPWEDRSPFRNGLIESQQSILDELEGASVYHIELTIPEDLVHITGREKVRYTNTEAVPLQEVELRLFPNLLGGRMDVSNVRIDDKTISPKYDLQNSLLILPFTTPLEPGQSSLLEMDFTVEVPQSVEQGYGLLSYTDNVLALAHAYPMVSVYDDEGWNAEILRSYGDITYTDVSFYLVKITAPNNLTLVPTGTEISRSEGGQTQVLTVANGPARDFYLAASANYREVTQVSGEVTLRSYAVEGEMEGAQAALRAAAQSLEDFDKRYGPYPYTELEIAATATNAAGIEYPGVIVIASNLYREFVKSSNSSPNTVLEAVVSHEVGHQWFYNLVGNDQLDDPWIDEAFAQLASLHYFREEYGPAGWNGLQQSLEDRWERVNHARIPVGLPVAAYTQTEYGAIVYGRGPLFLVALQKEMGDDNFDEFVKDYVTQLSWGIATSEFMQELAEQHCACDLDAIFAEWVYPK